MTHVQCTSTYVFEESHDSLVGLVLGHSRKPVGVVEPFVEDWRHADEAC